jgi:hypothetical protein
MEGRGEEGQGRKRGKGREEGGEAMIRNDRPSPPHQKILDPPLLLFIYWQYLLCRKIIQ